MTKYRVYLENKGESWELIYDTDSTDITRSIISPCIKLETNKAPGFDFTINRGHPSYDGFTEFKTFVYVFRDYDTNKEKCLFRGRVSEINTDVFGQRTITCEGDLAILADSIQSPNTFINVQTVGTTKKKKNVVTKTASMFVGDFFSSVITTHNNQMMEGYGNDSRKQFRVGAISHSKSTESKQFDLTSYSDTSSVLSSEILGRFGGIIRTRYIRSKSITYIDWIEDYTESSNQDIRFGVNLLDLDMDQPDDKPWSILLPIGNDGITIKDATSSEAISGVSIFNNIYLKNSDAFSKYGWVVHYEKFDDAKTANDLIHKAYEYMWTHKKEIEDNQKQLTVKAIDLQLLGESDDPLDLGDKILVKMNVEGNLGIEKIPCIEMTVDIQNPENNIYTLGNIALADDKGKATLTSQHSSRSKSTSAKVNYLSDEIDGLQRDVDTLGNNININAENIKAVAKDIAVVAENLTIAAQNIAITANTIDVKAQELTATFEDEIGDAKTKITATKDGIITEVNKKLYGENQDGTGGIVYDYNHQISITAEQTEDKLVKTIYKGSNGSGTTTNPAEGTILATYTAHMIRSPEVFNQSYTAELLYRGADGTGTIDNPAANTIVKKYGSDITQRADKIELAVWGKDAQGNLNTKSKIEINDDNIKLRVKSDEVISAINISKENIQIKAEKINLVGYVTATELSVTNGNFSKLISGQTTASKIVATRLDAKSNLYIGDSENAANLYYRGSQFSNCYIKVGASNPYRYVLGSLVSGNNTDIDLDHSHSVSVNNSTGRITLGNAVAAGSGGSFRIADTKTYKDGVSAVKVSSVSRNTDDRGVAILDTYDSTQKRITAHMKVALTNGNTENALHDVIVSANSAYNDGYTDGENSVTITSENIYERADPYYNSNTHNTTVYLKADISNGKSTTKEIVSDGFNAYNDGYDDGRNSVGDDASDVTIACYSSEMEPTSGGKIIDYNITVYLDNGKSQTKMIPLGTTESYNVGYSDGVGQGQSNIINALDHTKVVLDWVMVYSSTHAAVGLHYTYKPEYTYTVDLTLDSAGNGIRSRVIC